MASTADRNAANAKAYKRVTKDAAPRRKATKDAEKLPFLSPDKSTLGVMHSALKSKGYRWKQSNGVSGGTVQHEYQAKGGKQKAYIHERANGEHTSSLNDAAMAKDLRHPNGPQGKVQQVSGGQVVYEHDAEGGGFNKVDAKTALARAKEQQSAHTPVDPQNTSRGSLWPDAETSDFTPSGPEYKAAAAEHETAAKNYLEKPSPESRSALMAAGTRYSAARRASLYPRAVKSESGDGAAEQTASARADVMAGVTPVATSSTVPSGGNEAGRKAAQAKAYKQPPISAAAGRTGASRADVMAGVGAK